jgi:SNF2 family DNA or RNA helicase
MVYIMSPNWNPCIELQAIGRAYRKGQTQQVTCLRLVMNNTVEEKCIKIQERKMNIISEALMDESYSKRLGSCDKELTLNDIKSVFSCRADETEDDDPYTF